MRISYNNLSKEDQASEFSCSLQCRRLVFQPAAISRTVLELASERSATLRRVGQIYTRLINAFHTSGVSVDDA